MPETNLVEFYGNIAGFHYEILDTEVGRGTSPSGLEQAHIERTLTMNVLAGGELQPSSEFANVPRTFSAATEEGLDAAVATSFDENRDQVVRAMFMKAKDQAESDEGEVRSELLGRERSRQWGAAAIGAITGSSVLATAVSIADLAHNKNSSAGAWTAVFATTTFLGGISLPSVIRNNAIETIRDAGSSLRSVFRRTHMVELAINSLNEQSATESESEAVEVAESPIR